MSAAIQREYRPQDLERCIAIVNEAWDFDGRLRPTGLAEFVKRLYTAGSLAESRYAEVIVGEGRVEAFLFGRAGTGEPYRTEFSGIAGRFRALKGLLGMPGVGFGTKLGWLRALIAHQAARHRVHPVGEAEITLFAAAAASRGMGYGHRLMDAYVEHCRSLGVVRLTVETDVESSYGFYDSYGFALIGEFTSRMNQRFSGGTGRSFVYELEV